MSNLKNIDTSNELQIYRFNKGIKLLRAEQAGFPKSKHTVGSILQLPIGVYFIRADSINEKVNEHDAMSCGFDSAKSAIGKTCFSGFTKKSANITTQNDKEVMLTEDIKISEEDVVLSKDYSRRPTLSIKLPWYNDQNKVIGIFGCSIILGKHPLADSLSLVTNLGILNTTENISQFVGTEIQNDYLSRRQISCAKLLLSGMTIKQIAAYLNLSPRTVESYVENIKTKLNCRNKTELILKLYEHMKN